MYDSDEVRQLLAEVRDMRSERMRLRATVRDLVWLIMLAAVLAAWLVDRTALNMSREAIRDHASNLRVQLSKAERYRWRSGSLPEVEWGLASQPIPE